MMKHGILFLFVVGTFVSLWISVIQTDETERPTNDSVAKAKASRLDQVGHPTFVSPHATPIVVCGEQVFVANTPADTVDVINTATRKLEHRISVGIDPVSIAKRPDGKEVWVSNHVSDTVSVIDNDADSATYLQVIATIQDIDPRTKATRFDEPVGIAFASNDKAYVALSSENTIAVVDVKQRKVVKRLGINAQDPRAITVRNNRLYVIPFESNNKTQLSGGTGRLDGKLTTFNAFEHSIANNNVLSIGAVLDIVKHPRVPDRDLYIFDTETDKLISTVDTLGTLLYGLSVDSKGNVFIAQTDARNDANGRAGTEKHDLAELENRAFLNQITNVTFNDDGTHKAQFIDLEPLPPKHPDPAMALATPFAIQVSSDDSTLYVTAAGSDKLFTVDVKSNEVIGRANVGAVPRGIAVQEGSSDSQNAWVLNAVANTVSCVDVTNPRDPKVVETVSLEDPTHPTVKRGRIAFNTARASTTGTFACASCHPDGHTDQLLWVLKTPIVTGGNQIMPRSTMPIRGLRDTAPYHWDGIPGDPYGGNNSANVHGSDEPNSSLDDPASTTRHLIDGGLASTMAMVGDKTTNDEGKPGLLSASERDDMAVFLLSVPFPPAQRRAYTNTVSDRAARGFHLFHIDGDLQGDPTPNVCGNCHRMPFLVSTNTPGTGMDAPTWRGAYDRFLILPQGRLNIIDFDFYHRVAERGIPERSVWQFSWAGRRRFDPVWDMVLEGSTGFSGALGRQVTLNRATAKSALSRDMLDALEQSARENAIILEADGVIVKDGKSTPISLQYHVESDDGKYVNKTSVQSQQKSFTRADLVSFASLGKFVGTVSARHGSAADVDHPQPAIWTLGPIERQRGRQVFPILHHGNHKMTVSGRHIQQDAWVIVDGRRTDGKVTLESKETVVIAMQVLPDEGMHLLQLQNPGGLFSNDFIFHVVKDADDALALQKRLDAPHVDPQTALVEAIERDDLRAVKSLLDGGRAKVNGRRPRDGSTALGTAAFRGHVDIVEYLIKQGADVNHANRDRNTPLIVAAFMCHKDVVQLLLQHGASIEKENRRGENAMEVVSSEWTDELARFYAGIGAATGIKVDLDRLQFQRPKLAKMLRTHLGH